MKRRAVRSFMLDKSFSDRELARTGVLPRFSCERPWMPRITRHTRHSNTPSIKKMSICLRLQSVRLRGTARHGVVSRPGRANVDDSRLTLGTLRHPQFQPTPDGTGYDRLARNYVASVCLGGTRWTSRVAYEVWAQSPEFTKPSSAPSLRSGQELFAPTRRRAHWRRRSRLTLSGFPLAPIPTKHEANKVSLCAKGISEHCEQLAQFLSAHQVSRAFSPFI